MTVRANLADNLANLGLETHVKHAVSLVKNQVGYTTEIGLASLEHINQTARCGNADLNTARKVTNLRTLGDTTVNASVANARRATELGDFLLDLDSKLTSGSKHQNDGTVARSQKRLGIDVDDRGQTIRKCLSGTSLSNTDDITTRESHGPTLRLNSGGGGETLCLDFVHNVTGETSLVKSLNRLGNVASSNRHRVLVAELADLRIRAVGDFGMLLVERLLELGEGREVWNLVSVVVGIKKRMEVRWTYPSLAA